MGTKNLEDENECADDYEVKGKNGIPKSIQEYGIGESEFISALDAFDDQCTGANPRYPINRRIKRNLSKSILWT